MDANCLSACGMSGFGVMSSDIRCEVKQGCDVRVGNMAKNIYHITISSG